MQPRVNQGGGPLGGAKLSPWPRSGYWVPGTGRNRLEMAEGHLSIEVQLKETPLRVGVLAAQHVPLSVGVVAGIPQGAEAACLKMRNGE